MMSVLPCPAGFASLQLERLTLVCSGGEQEGIVSAPSICDAYIARYQQAVQQLQTLVYRSMCPQLVQSEGVLAKMCDSSRCRWDAKQLRQTPHEWVSYRPPSPSLSFLVH